MTIFQHPRGFRHTFIYYDERKDRLRQMEERARASLEREQSQECPVSSESKSEDSVGSYRETLRFRTPDRPFFRPLFSSMTTGLLLFVIVLLLVVLLIIFVSL